MIKPRMRWDDQKQRKEWHWPPETERTTAQLCTCPICGKPAQHETAPNGEMYVTCGHCAAITFDATGEEDEPSSEFYAQGQPPIGIPSVLEAGDGSPPFCETECAICYSLQPCYDDGEAYVCVDRVACNERQSQNANPACTCSFSMTDAGWITRKECAVCKEQEQEMIASVPPELLAVAASAAEHALDEAVDRMNARVNWSEGQPAQPTYTITEQLEALRKEAHAAKRQGLTEVVSLLKDRACALVGDYLDTDQMCDKGHRLDEQGQCPACLTERDLLNKARDHVAVNLEMHKIEALVFDLPC